MSSFSLAAGAAVEASVVVGGLTTMGSWVDDSLTDGLVVSSEELAVSTFVAASSVSSKDTER